MTVSEQRGFSLIEVLAAMVIFSAGAVILFGWIAQTADRLGRLGQEQQSLLAELTGLEFIRTLNPMRQPAGEMTINEVIVRWDAKPVGEESPVRSGGGEGNYLVQLYQVELRTSAGKAEASSQSLYLAGWRERPNAPGSRPFSGLLDRLPNAPAPPKSP